jgi:environmental stress-induced protein Ves
MVKKTLHELAKEFPEKSYRELEKYRDADRQEEAQQILIKQENEELLEDQQSSEMLDAKKEITKLKKEICELRQDNRKLAHEVEDRVTRMRKAGM